MPLYYVCCNLSKAMTEDENQNSWNSLAKLYLERFGNEIQYDEWIRTFCLNLPSSPAKILDLGCGPGINAKKILEYCPDAQLTGIDFAPNMVETARNHVPDAHFQVGDIRKIPQFQHSFDGIFASFSIPYINDGEVEKMIVSSHSRMQKGGIFFLSFIESSINSSKKSVNSAGLPMIMYYYEVEWIETVLVNHGFDVIETFKHYEAGYGADSSQLCAIISRT